MNATMTFYPCARCGQNMIVQEVTLPPSTTTGLTQTMRTATCRYCEPPAPDAPAERERTAREVLGTLDKDSPGVVAALWWALDMLDMYDRELLRRGDPPEKVNSATHLEAKAKSRRALNAAVAAISVPVEP